MLSSPQHSPVNQSANTSETNTSDKCFSKDLSQILVNIKSCRWRHFRPRTPSLHDSDNDELSCRKLYRSVNRTGTAQPGTQTCSTSTQSKSSSGSAHFGTFICFDVRLCRSLGFISFGNMWSVILTAKSPLLLKYIFLKSRFKNLFESRLCMCLHLNISAHPRILVLFIMYGICFLLHFVNHQESAIIFSNNMERKWTVN